MKKQTIFTSVLFTLLVTTFLLLQGCDSGDADDNGGTTPPAVTYNLDIQNLQQQYVGIDGETQRYQLQINATTDEGLLASDKLLRASVLSGSASFVENEIRTNQYGNVFPELRLEFSEGSQVVQLRFEIEGSRYDRDVRLIGIRRPATVTLSADNRELSVPRGENAEINFTATVRDAGGSFVQGITLKFEIQPETEGGNTFGTVTVPALTNFNGQTTATFRSLGDFGTQVMHCHVKASDNYLSEVSSQLTFSVSELDEQIGTFLLQADPVLVEVDPSAPGTSQLTLTVKNQQNLAMQDIAAEFSATVGGVINIEPTDETGRSYSQYIVEYDEIPDTVQSARITATIPGSAWQSSVNLSLFKEEAQEATIRLASDTRRIIADNGITSANIEALVRDQWGYPVANEPVVFTAAQGVALSPRVTDENGITRTVFTDIGQPSVDQNGNPDSVEVFARVDRLSVQSSIRIMIEPWMEIDSIDVTLSDREIAAGSLDPLTITTTCLRPDGNVISEPIPMHITAVKGIVYPANTSTERGIAQVEYTPPESAGIDTVLIQATVDNQQITRQAFIQVIPNVPARGEISVEPQELYAGDPRGEAEVIARITDRFENPVNDGITVTFATNNGMISPRSRTDSEGSALAVYRAGSTVGAAQIEITVESQPEDLVLLSWVNLVAPPPETILLSANPLELESDPDGEVRETTIIARVNDAYGNPVQTMNTQILFEILGEPDPPIGCSFLNDAQTHEMRIIEGIAELVMFAGTRTGLKRIRATTWRDEDGNDPVSIELNTIRVVPGPPNVITVDYNPLGRSMGATSWEINLWAVVQDEAGNPVQDNIQIDFLTDPEILEIPPGFTGNRSLEGEIVPGYAFTSIEYESDQTFTPIDIIAQTEDIRGSIQTHVPLQQGDLNLVTDINNWNFDEDGEIAQIEIRATLLDGHDERINWGTVLFTQTSGSLYFLNQETGEFERIPGRPARRTTGLNDVENQEDPGEATVFLIAEEDDIFDNPDQNASTVEIVSRLESYEEVLPDTVRINFLRRIEE